VNNKNNIVRNIGSGPNYDGFSFNDGGLEYTLHVSHCMPRCLHSDTKKAVSRWVRRCHNGITSAVALWLAADIYSLRGIYIWELRMASRGDTRSCFIRHSQQSVERRAAAAVDRLMEDADVVSCIATASVACGALHERFGLYRF